MFNAVKNKHKINIAPYEDFFFYYYYLTYQDKI